MTNSWQTVLSIVGAAGGLCGLWSLWYARRQTLLMEKQIRKQDTQDREDLNWSDRFQRLASQLVRINFSFWITPPGKSQINLYPAIFPDSKFREALQTYIVQLDSSPTQFSQRKPDPHELRGSNMMETIQKAEQCMAEFQKQNPTIDLKYYTG